MIKATTDGEPVIQPNIANVTIGDLTPRHKASMRPDEESNVSFTSLPSLEGVQVLLVDDDQDTLNMFAIILTQHKAKVVVASSTAEALELLQWYKPDVLVSDLAMPNEDGYSLIKKVRTLEAESGRQSLAIALTAYVRGEDRARALSEGFNMFLSKPLDPNELITAIAKLAEQSKTKFV